MSASTEPRPHDELQDPSLIPLRQRGVLAAANFRVWLGVSLTLALGAAAVFGWLHWSIDHASTWAPRWSGPELVMWWLWLMAVTAFLSAGALVGSLAVGCAGASYVRNSRAVRPRRLLEAVWSARRSLIGVTSLSVSGWVLAWMVGLRGGRLLWASRLARAGGVGVLVLACAEAVTAVIEGRRCNADLALKAGLDVWKQRAIRITGLVWVGAPILGILVAATISGLLRPVIGNLASGVLAGWVAASVLVSVVAAVAVSALADTAALHRDYQQRYRSAR